MKTANFFPLINIICSKISTESEKFKLRWSYLLVFILGVLGCSLLIEYRLVYGIPSSSTYVGFYSWILSVLLIAYAWIKATKNEQKHKELGYTGAILMIGISTITQLLFAFIINKILF